MLPASSSVEPVQSVLNDPSNSLSSTSATLPLTTNAHPMLTRSNNGIFKPKVLSVQTNYSYTEPPSYSVASKYSHWVDAMDSEFTSLQQ